MSHRPSQTSFSALTLTPLMLLVVAGFGIVGCTEAPPKAPAEKTENNVDTSDKTTSVLPTDSIAEISPAVAAVNPESNQPKEPVDVSPESTCRAFMDLLQSGNRLGAENLLTRLSIANITKAGLKLEPMGGANAEYKLGSVHFATTKQELAHVDCVIEEMVDGKPVQMKVSWQVRRIEKAWRISGVILETKAGQAPDLLSFENQIDVAKIQSLAGEEIIDGQPTREANASNAAGKSNSELK